MIGDGGRFNPQSDITRAEIVTMLLRLKGIEPDAAYTDTFRDVAADDWFSGAVLKASELGIVTGYDGNFAPNDTITRQDMAAVIARAFALSAGDTADIADIGLADEYAVGHIGIVYSSGIMLGSDGFFDPLGQVKREMAAVIVVRLYDGEN
jgi:hypothetical protein